MDPSLSRRVAEPGDGLVSAGQGVRALGAAASVLTRHATVTRDRGTRGTARVTVTRVAAITPPGPVSQLPAAEHTV